MRQLRSLFALGLTLLIGTAAVAQHKIPSDQPQADIIVFINGDQLSGHLIRAENGLVVFHSDMTGDIHVPFHNVKELRSQGSFSVLKKGKPGRINLVGQGQVSVDGGNVVVKRLVLPPVTLHTSNVGYVIDTPTFNHEVLHEAGFFHEWTGGIRAGATLVRATSDDNVFTAGIELKRVIPDVIFAPLYNRTTFNLNQTYGKAITKQPEFTRTKTSIFHVDGERDEYFKPELYALVNTSLDHNYSQGLDLQQLYGGGIGWTAIQSDPTELNFKAEVHYMRQTFFTAPGVNLVGSIFGETYRRELPRGIVLSQAANFVPSWNNTQAYSAFVRAGIVLPAWRRLGTAFNVQDDYLNNPSPGYLKNSFQFAAGLNFALH